MTSYEWKTRPNPGKQKTRVCYKCLVEADHGSAECLEIFGKKKRGICKACDRKAHQDRVAKMSPEQKEVHYENIRRKSAEYHMVRRAERAGVTLPSRRKP